MNDAALPDPMTALQAALSSAQQVIGSLQQENKLLREKLQLFLQRYFGGKKNESIAPAQLEWLLAGLLREAATPPAVVPANQPVAAARKKAVRQPLPKHLPVERVVLEPEEIKTEPGSWKKIGEEVTEELDWKPAKFIKRLYIRPKYVRAEKVVIAPLPARLIDKGLPGAGLLAQIILQQIRRPPAALPAGENFPRTSRRSFKKTESGGLGGAGGAVAPADLSGDETILARRRIHPGR